MATSPRFTLHYLVPKGPGIQFTPRWQVWDSSRTRQQPTVFESPDRAACEAFVAGAQYAAAVVAKHLNGLEASLSPERWSAVVWPGEQAEAS